MPDLKKWKTEAEKWRPPNEEERRLDSQEWRWLRWSEAFMGSHNAGELPSMSRWWRYTVRRFFCSGKPELGVLAGMRAIKSHTSCLIAVTEGLFRERKPVLGTDLVWGVYSCDMPEANGRASTLAAFLGALGHSKVEKKDSVIGNESGYAKVGSGNGRSSIFVHDVSGNLYEYRIAPATSGGASGYTGVGITCDELDLWKDGDGVNPASEVLSVLRPRLFGQSGTHMYRISAPFSETSPHTRDVMEGDDDSQFVGRLWDFGAKRDQEARATLASFFRERARGAESRSERDRLLSYADDARLHEPADPNDVRIPTWVARDGDLREIMEDCWRRAARDAKKDGADPLVMLFARFGARPYGRTGGRAFDAIALERAAQVPADP